MLRAVRAFMFSRSNPSLWRVLALVFGSGFCALIYQVVWSREFRLVFGASTAASAAVVAIFAAGLGLGGLWLGRRVERSVDPLAFYANLEASIAVSSALTPWLIDAVRVMYIASGGTPALGNVGASVVRLALAALVLGIPTFLMGGTLPAIARAIETDRDIARRGIAWAYGANTFGAVLGCALSTFALLEIFGSRHTLWIACAVNALVAVVARSHARQLLAADSFEASVVESGSQEVPAALTRWVLLSAAVVGAAFFLMELVWYRLLGPLLGGSVFTFGLILAVALAGIGSGGALYALLLSTERPRLSSFALTCALEALLIAFPYALGDRVAVWAILLRPLGGVGFAGLLFGWGLLAALFVFPAALLAGLQFPLLIALLGSGRTQVGRDVGRAYASNTLGAILGALSGGFGLMSALGALACLRWTALALCAWGTASALWSLRVEASRKSLPLVAAAAIGTVLLLSAPGPSAAFRHSPIGAGRVNATNADSPNAARAFLAERRASILWQTEGVESAVALDGAEGLSFVVNGKSDGNAVTDAATQVMSGLLGAALAPHPTTALVIGLGTGSSAGWLAALPSMTRVDVAEIEPAIREVARRCAPVNEHVLDNPKVTIMRGDARELLAVSRSQYDVIFSEPSNPYRAGIASLYTREFYRAVAERLAKHGRFVQWVQGYDIDTRTIRTIYATLASEFRYVETWNGYASDLLLVATREPPLHDVQALRARLAEPTYRRALRAAWFSEGVAGLFAHYVANPAFAREALSAVQGELSTDDLSPIEFGFGREVGSSFVAADSVLGAARSRQLQRPRLDGVLDFDRVEFEHALSLLAIEHKANTEPMPAAYRARFAVLRAWSVGDMHGALSMLEALGETARADPTPLERVAHAEILVQNGHPDAESALLQLAASAATETHALRFQLLLRNGAVPEALEEFDRAVAGYREAPWALAPLMRRMLASARYWASTDLAQAPRIMATLREPFAVYAEEDARQRTRAQLARALGVAHPACLELFGSLEPNAPWTQPMLEFRAACYAAHAHPRASQARADLTQFIEDAPRGFDELLPSRVETVRQAVTEAR